MYVAIGSIFVVAVTALAGALFKCKTPPKIYGIYSQASVWYYAKYAIAYALLSWRKHQNKFVEETREERKPGQLRKQRYIDRLEKLQELSHHEKAFDAVFFQAANSAGYYLSGGIERRHKGQVNNVFYVVVPELGLLRSNHLPETQQPAGASSLVHQTEYSSSGFTLRPIEPMKTWNMSFTNTMWCVQRKKLVDVNLIATWTSKLPYFLFEKDISSESLARALALEPWSRSLFQNLKTAHQTHYEQMGTLTGTLTVDGQTFPLKLDAFRDHSFGNKRDWSLMHRYAFHILHLSDGMRICAGFVCQPCTTSRLLLGYVLYGDGTLSALADSDFNIWEHGEWTGRPGQQVAFRLRCDNGATFLVKLDTVHEDEHFKGSGDDSTDRARLLERFVKCDVNGVSGRGVSEWQFQSLIKH